jgi:hypothetical protein
VGDETVVVEPVLVVFEIVVVGVVVVPPVELGLQAQFSTV